MSQLIEIKIHGCGRGSGNIPSSPGPLPASAKREQLAVNSYWLLGAGNYSGRHFYKGRIRNFYHSLFILPSKAKRGLISNLGLVLKALVLLSRAFANSPLLKRSANKFQSIKKYLKKLLLQAAGYHAQSLAGTEAETPLYNIKKRIQQSFRSSSGLTGEIGRPVESCHAFIRDRTQIINSSGQRALPINQ